MTSAKKRGYSNVSSLRRKLRKLPESIQADVASAMEQAALAVQQDMIEMTPQDSGDVRRAIDYKMSRDKFSARIGPGASKMPSVKSYRKKYGKYGRSKDGKTPTAALTEKVYSVTDLFYFRFLDAGTKGFSGTYTIKKGKRKDTKVTAHIPPMPALHIRQRAKDRNRAFVVNSIRAALKKNMTRVARRG